MKRKLKYLSSFGLALLMAFSIVNVSAADSVSKTKSGTVTCGTYGSLSATDKATRNLITGSWSTKHLVKIAKLKNGYRASASEGGSKKLTNNGFTLSHSAAFAVYYNSNAQFVGAYFKSFTFTYNLKTNKIS